MQLNDVAIIGHTGFIGSNMAKMVQADKFSSSNIHKIKEKEYETIYCCAPGATKWMINKAPEKDFQNIESLSHIIEKTNCKRFVLFSTIDVMTFKQKLSYAKPKMRPY